MLHNHIVVTILHDTWEDWIWDDDPTSENFGEEYLRSFYDPFYVVQIYDDKYGVVTYGELPSYGEVQNVEYRIAKDLQELSEIIPEQLFGEILYDFASYQE
jgi:hypothetical protein